MEQEKALRQELSYVVGGSSSYFSGYGLKRRSLLSKRGEFPTGLLNRVLASMTTSEKIVNTRVVPVSKPSAWTGIKPYKDQLKAVEAACYHHRGIIQMPTGTGKSLVIALIASRLNVKTLVVVPSLEIKKQLYEALKGFKNVTVENIDSAALKKLKDFDCLIIDEGHHVAAKTYQKLNKEVWTGIYYRFFLTATPFRNDTEETLLFESIAGQVIFNLDYKTAVANNYIVPVEGYYIDIPKQDTDAYTYAQVYKELVVDNVLRNRTLANLLITLQQNNIYTLCLVREVRHGQILADLTDIPFVSGADDESRDYIRQFNRGEIKTIIGTEGILSEGVDTKPCEYAVIAGLGKAKSNLMQKVGRSVRNYPGKESAKVIIIKDSSHKFLLRHFNAQKKILKEEYGCIIKKLEV